METKIKIGGSVEFEKVLQEKINFPCELALFYKYEKWLEIENRLDEIYEIIKSRDISVISLHGPRACISTPPFLKWSEKLLLFAEKLNVNFITLHPEMVKIKRKPERQKTFKEYFDDLTKRFKPVFCIETFMGWKRLFRPEEIIEANLPMTLDTSHIRNNELIFKIIDTYWQNIKVLHLSARKEDAQHLPVDEFCFNVVERLLNYGWNGVIILEYRDEYFEQIPEDIEKIKTLFGL